VTYLPQNSKKKSNEEEEEEEEEEELCFNNVDDEITRGLVLKDFLSLTKLDHKAERKEKRKHTQIFNRNPLAVCMGTSRGSLSLRKHIGMKRREMQMVNNP
jgi:energy-converting hydrogenase A subunit M